MRRRGAVSIDVVLSGASALCYRMICVVEVFSQIKTVGLNPFQVVLVGTVGQTVAFVGPAPMGILADMYSRRWAVVLGFLLAGRGYLIEGLLPWFGAVLAGQVVAVFNLRTKGSRPSICVRRLSPFTLEKATRMHGHRSHSTTARFPLAQS